MARHSFEHVATANAPPAQVWASLQRADTWEAIDGVDDVEDPVTRNGDLAGFRFAATAGGRRYPGRAEVIDAGPLDRLVLAIDTGELRGLITVGLRPVPEGTEVSVLMDVEPKSFGARMLMGVIASAIESGFASSVEDFAERAARPDQPQ